MINNTHLDLSLLERLSEDVPSYVQQEQLQQASRYSGDVIGGIVEGGADIAGAAFSRSSAPVDAIGNSVGYGASAVAEAGGALAGTAAEAGGAILSCIGEVCGAVLGCAAEFLCACICGIFDGL